MIHGRRSGYQSGCQCAPCLEAGRTYQREWARRRRRPDYTALRARVPAGPVRRHLLELLAAGHTLRVISQTTGVSQAALSRIARGRFSTVHRRTRSAILAFAPANIASVNTISSWDDLEDLVYTLTQILDDRRAPWRRHAACRHPGVTVDTFFAGRGEPVDQAKTRCADCTVATDCLAYATRHHIGEGIWGGTAHKERRPGRRVA